MCSRFGKEFRMNGSEQTIKELTLMLLYLTSWQDKPARMRPDAAGRVSWKGYAFDTLDAFLEEGLIHGERRSKLVILDDSGIIKAKSLLAQYGVTEGDA